MLLAECLHRERQYNEGNAREVTEAQGKEKVHNRRDYPWF
jgi:hypothetical protein